MLAVRGGAVRRIDHGNQFVDDDLFEGGRSKEARPSSCLCRGGAGSRWRGRPWSWRRFAWLGSVPAIHHNDHRLGFLRCDQVIQNEAGPPLHYPTGLVLPSSVLEVENGVPRARVDVVIG